MRIRTVKPEYFTHPEIAPLSPWARLLFVSLWTQADDEGRLYDQPRKISGLALGPRDPVDAEDLLRELAQNGRIIRYEAKGRRCIQVVHFNDHQVISHPSPSRIPPVPKGYKPPSSGQGTLLDSSGNSHGTVQDGSRKITNGNRERKGKEQGTGKGREHVLAPQAAQRTRDLIFEVFCDVTNVNWSELSEERRGALNGMYAAIKRQGGTSPDELRRRASNYHATFTTPLTPETLTRRWAELGNARPPTPERKPTKTEERLAVAAEMERREHETERGSEVDDQAVRVLPGRSE